MNLPSWAALGPIYQSFDQMAASSKGLISWMKAAGHRGPGWEWGGGSRKILQDLRSGWTVVSEGIGLYT